MGGASYAGSLQGRKKGFLPLGKSCRKFYSKAEQGASWHGKVRHVNAWHASQKFTSPLVTGVDPEDTEAVSVTTVPLVTEVTGTSPACTLNVTALEAVCTIR